MQISAKINFGAQNLTCIGKSSRFHMQIIGVKTTFVRLHCNVSILQCYEGGSGVICNAVFFST